MERSKQHRFFHLFFAYFKKKLPKSRKWAGVDIGN